MKLNLAIFHHISSACNSKSVEEVSSLHLVTTGGVLTTLKAKKVVSNSSFNRIQEMTALTLKP